MALEAAIRSDFIENAVDVLVKKLGSPGIEGLFRSPKLSEGLLDKLTKTLNNVKSIFTDAKGKQITGEGAKKCLDDVQDAIYEVEDLLDEIVYEVQVPELDSGSPSYTDQIRNFFSSRYTSNEKKKKKEKTSREIKQLQEEVNALHSIIQDFRGKRRDFKVLQDVIRSTLSSAIDVLVEKLASSEVLGFFNGRNIHKGILKKLTETLNIVKIMLLEAKWKQVVSKKDLNQTLLAVKDALCETANLLDEIFFVAGRQKDDSNSSADPTKNVVYSSDHENLVKNFGIVYEKLKCWVEKGDLLHKLLEVKPARSVTVSPNYVHVDTRIYGRDEAQNAIIRLLLSDDAKGQSLQVIPIVGISGIGKTTLAKLVYINVEVQKWFDLKAWVNMSKEFDVLRIIKVILKEIDVAPLPVSTNANPLQLEIERKLRGKKLLLVLDDVWRANHGAQWFLLKALASSARGSQIIVTTRESQAVSVLPCFPPCCLKPISDDDCWLLFSEVTFSGENSEARSELESKYRSKIVGSCSGLPLAAVTLGRQLKFEARIEEWARILEEVDQLMQPKTVVASAIKLSYYDFPPKLKQCFAYCALFPKGYLFNREELVLLWLAHGFLDHPHESKELKEAGYLYFQKLVSGSFFIEASADTSTPSFIMNDLVYEWAKMISGEFFVSFDGDDSRKISSKTRHLWCGASITCKDLENLEGQSLRSILPQNKSFWKDVNDDEAIDRFLSRFKRLRVLSLSDINKLPDSVSNMKQLRHLDLSGTSIKSLPAKILFNLQTLILHGCQDLVELPADIVKSTELCHLDIGETKLQHMPSQMGKLTKLQTLTDFFVGKQTGSSIDELGNLECLQGELRIWNLENVPDNRSAFRFGLIFFREYTNLKELELRWSRTSGIDDSQKDENLLSELLPGKKLEGLSIVCYSGKRLPPLLGGTAFSNMVHLKLSECKYCTSLPPLGQLKSLTTLLIEAFFRVEKVGKEFYGDSTSTFPSLKSLTFERMLQWREWESHPDGTVFSRLEFLCMRKCPNLKKALPSNLSALVKLEITKCQSLSLSPPESSRINNLVLGDDFHKTILDHLSQSLTVESFQSLDFILKEIEPWGYSYSTLKKFDITLSPIESFPLELFPILKQLDISRCPNLESILAQEQPALESLTISNCSSLESVSCFLPSLLNLKIADCEQLESFLEAGLSSKLESLEIHGCHKLLAVCKEWDTERICEYPNLKHLSLGSCPNLKSVPCFLPSLVNLELNDCGELGSFSGLGLSSLPGVGLSIKLESIVIRGCSKLLAGCSKWDLCQFRCLSSFSFSCYTGVESFPGQLMLLPMSLTSLSIWDLRNLKQLDLQGLKSLETLELKECPKLQAMPEASLPSSLTSLSIMSCPFLERRFRQRIGEGWLKNSSIPNVQLNGRKIKREL